MAADHRPLFTDPKMALPFKKIFGPSEHRGLLIDLLNTLLRLSDQSRIMDVEYLPRNGMKLSDASPPLQRGRGSAR